MSYSFEDYVRQVPCALEIVPYTLYDTEAYIAGVTNRLSFFTTTKIHPDLSNMYVTGMLPNPCSMLIERIQIKGVTSRLERGSCVLNIGNKHYGYNPAWRYALKQRGVRVSPPLMIPPMLNFNFVMQWEHPVYLGAGFNGIEKPVIPLQVCLIGKYARSIA